MDSTVENVISVEINNIINNITFEYDNEVWEYCAYFNNINWYFWQWKTRNKAFVELIESYLDTKDL
jgi:hypothetical protein